MPDGSITFSTKVDNKQTEKDLAKIERDIERLEKRIASHKAAKLPLVQQADELGAKLDAAKAKLAELQSQQQSVTTNLSGADPQAYINAYAQKPEIDSAVTQQQAQVDALQRKWDALNIKIDTYNHKIAVANTNLTAQTAKAGVLAAKQSAGGASMAAAMAKAQKAASLFQQRIMGIVKRVVVFAVISKALSGIVSYIGKATKTNEEFNAQLAKLKGALLTAFQPIYETLIPALIALMRVATSVVQSVAQVFSLLSGKTASENAKNAKALYEEANAIDEVGSSAKKANKSLASFDEINSLSSNENAEISGGAATSTPDFTDFDTAEYKGKIDELTVYISGALLALGAILAFSGVKIGLGITLMAAGAIGLVSEIATNWNCMSSELSNAITLVLGVLGGAALVIGAVLAFSGADIFKGIALMAIGAAALGATVALNWNTIAEALQGPIGAVAAVVSVALLALGAILAFSGAALPLGIALMVLGAAGLATTAALNWDTITDAIRGPVGDILAIVSGALLVLGIILLFTGAGIPLGIGLILAGAAGLATVVAFNWNSIVDSIKGVWQKIKDFWNKHIAKWFTKEHWLNLAKGIGNGLITGVEKAINGVISLFETMINWVVGGLNKISFDVPDWVPLIGGKKFGFNIPKVNFGRVSIPRLATGAVIPPNREFLAVLGDQRHGTNVEAPLDTIKQALAEVLAMQQGGGGETVIRFTGDLAQLGRILKPVIEKEDQRTGQSLAKGATL